VRILFLNQFFPPDPAPTGMLLAEVAQELRAQGHEVDLVATRSSYRGGHNEDGRWLRLAGALCRILCDGIRRPRAGLVVSGTSPPCLLVVATLVSVWHRAQSIHWIMDLYPEIAVALGVVRKGMLARSLQKLMGVCYRRCTCLVVLEPDMAARVGLYGVKAETIRPWVFAPILGRPLPALAPEPPWTWVYSGNLGRAHEWETLLAAQALVEQRDPEIRLLFQGGGASWPEAQARARELRLARCEWRGYVEDADLPASLLRGQVMVVTQLPAAQGLLWPSKLALMMTLPRPILWVGPKEGAIARELGAFPHCALFAPGEVGAVADWLLARKQQAAAVPPEALLDARAQRAEALAAWARLVPRPAPGPR
jgi:colanic acid biosynthesis glycosyl transferase WcaI